MWKTVTCEKLRYTELLLILGLTLFITYVTYRKCWLNIRRIQRIQGTISEVISTEQKERRINTNKQEQSIQDRQAMLYSGLLLQTAYVLQEYATLTRNTETLKIQIQDSSETHQQGTYTIRPTTDDATLCFCIMVHYCHLSWIDISLMILLFLLKRWVYQSEFTLNLHDLPIRVTLTQWRSCEISYMWGLKCWLWVVSGPRTSVSLP